jgi:hypothetical protein
VVNSRHFNIPSKGKLVTFFVFISYSSSLVAQTQSQPNQSKIAQIQQQENKPAQIDKGGLLMLVRHVLHALELSNKSGNYSVLREISAPGFAAVNDANRLSQLFRNLRERNVDLSGVLIYEPQLTVMPEITKEGLMRFAGFFPSASNQIKFEMVFAPVNGQWKLFGIAADVAPPGPSAPAPPPQNIPARPEQRNK